MVTVTVAVRKWTDPPRLLTVLIVASFASTAIFWALQHYQTQADYSFFYNISFSALTAFVASRIGLWVYRFLADEGQRREWRHDLELRYFENIYGPLYLDTKAAIESLKSYQIPQLQKWYDVKERSQFGPFVEPGIAKDLDDLQQALRDNTWLNVAAYNSAVRTITKALANRFGPALDPPVWSPLVDSLVQDQRYLFDPDVPRPHDAHVANVRNHLRQTGLPDSEGYIDKMIAEVKDALVKDDVIGKRVSVCRAILPAADAAHARILRRMKDPFEQT